MLFLYTWLFYALQIVAAPSQDRLCLAVAEALEKDLGGWIPPTAEPSGKYNYVNETKWLQFDYIQLYTKLMHTMGFVFHVDRAFVLTCDVQKW